MLEDAVVVQMITCTTGCNRVTVTMGIQGRGGYPIINILAAMEWSEEATAMVRIDITPPAMVREVTATIITTLRVMAI